MKRLVLEQLRRLGADLGDLRGRVRAAVAGEVGRAVAAAAAEVAAAALGGRRAGPRGRWADPDGRDDWDDWDDDYRAGRRRAGARAPTPDDEFDDGPAPPAAAAALAAAAAAGRWWLVRAGTPWGAAGLGLAAAGAVLFGGPTVRAVAAAVWAAHRLAAATDALGDTARALDRL